MDSAVLAEIELPDDVEEALAELDQTQERVELSELGQLVGELIDMRDVCIDGRKSSGIEGAWTYCEDSYIGIDEANRHEFHSNRWLKPLSPDGTVSKDDGDKRAANQNRAIVYPPLTRRYVNAAVAKVWEIVNDPEEMPFETKPTPVPDVVEKLNDHSRVEENGVPLDRDPTAKEMNPGTGGTPEHPLPLQQPPDDPEAQAAAPGKPLKQKDLAEEAMQKAEESAKRMGKRIHDQMVEGRFAVKDRRCIRDGAKMGTGIIKGPVPDVSRGVRATRVNGQLKIEINQDVKPVPEHVSVWDFYPDPACGEDIQNGSMTFERRDLTRGRVQKLAKLDGYDPRAIAAVLKETPKRITDIPEHRQLLEQDQKQLPYEAWFFYCQLPQEKFRMLRQNMNKPKINGKEVEDTFEDELTDVHVQGTIINDQLVQLVEQPNEKTGEFPYNLFVWTQRDGSPFGVGVAEQGMAAQRIATNAVRRMIDNAGYSSGIQLILDPELVEPVPVEGQSNPWVFNTYKMWWKKTGAGLVDDMRKAMTTIQFPSAHAQLSWIVEFSFKLFEETTNIPLISQGWSGETTPETLGGMEMQDSNANQMLRDVAENHDYGVIVPYVQKSIEWNLLDPDVPDDEKIEMKIFARGSTAFMDRYLQRQVYERHMPMLIQGHNILGVNPTKAFEEMWRSYRMNPKSIQYTEKEKEALAQQPPPEPVQVTVEKMRSQLKMQELKLRAQQAMDELKIRKEIADAQVQVKLMEYATMRQISLDEAKTEMAKTTMQLNTQMQISAHNTHTETARQVAKEGTEVPGRAPDGEAFEK